MMDEIKTQSSSSNDQVDFQKILSVETLEQNKDLKIKSKLIAGQTMMFSNDKRENTWSYCESSSFSLRSGTNYERNKVKEPSLPEFYDVVGVDFFKTESRIDHIASKITIPIEWLSRITNNPYVPPLYIVNVQIPQDFQSGTFTSVSDGPGWSLVIYLLLKPEVCFELADMTRASPPLKLFSKFCRFAPDVENSPLKGRFKVMCRLNNMKDFSLPSFITAYNSKPVLIKNTITTHKGEQYIETDINVHRFAALPKKALETLFSRFPLMYLSIGFCIGT